MKLRLDLAKFNISGVLYRVFTVENLLRCNYNERVSCSNESVMIYTAQFSALHFQTVKISKISEAEPSRGIMHMCYRQVSAGSVLFG